MENRGKLLVSTQCNPTKKLILQIVCILAAIFLLFIATDNDGMISDLCDELDSKFWDFAIPGLISLWVAVGLVDTFMYFKSYCMVYENAVVGTSRFKIFNATESLKAFTLNYNEINNVTESKGVIQIYTSYATFKVIATDNCAEAVQEIRKRMSNSTPVTPVSGAVNSGHTSGAQNTQTPYIGLNTQNNRNKKQ